MEIFTIGYAGFEIENFIKVLKEHHINSLIDVRSSPFSKIYSDYNKPLLHKTLQNRGIIYRNYNREFGARQEDKMYYPNGYLDFSMFTRSRMFIEGMEKIIKAIPLGYKFVLMCSEKDPITCHRTIMVGKAFFDKGISINHILSDGQITTQSDIEIRLLDMYYPDRDQLTLFGEQLSIEEMIKNCYRFQNEKIGYRLDNDEEDYYD